MIMNNGIMDTTQCKNIISPQNSLKSLSTHMHKVKQRKSRVPIYTNCEKDDVNLGCDDDGDVSKYGNEQTPSHMKGDLVVMTDEGVDFPSTAAVEQQDLPSPKEEEDFRLRLRKIRKNLGIGFSSGRRFNKKEETRRRSGTRVGPTM
jgi:hypothetical protein